MLDIEKYKDIHKGGRCFVLGTGPSLNETRLDLLRDEIVFGVNALYKGLTDFGISCDYYAIADDKVYREHIDNIVKYPFTLFIDHNAYMIVKDKRPLVDKRQSPTVFVGGKSTKIWHTNRIQKDLTKGFWGGGSIITSMAIPICYYMGFSKVYLVGVDCDYSNGHRFDGSNTENPEGLAGGIYSDRHWDILFRVYEILKSEFEEDGREILNATVGGKLEVFRRCDLQDILQ